MRHCGILAHSAEGAALCFLTFCHEGAREMGAHLHPDVSLDCIAMGQSMPAWDAGNYAPIRDIHARSIERLAAASADFFVCPDNTSHIALETDGADFALPGLNIADVVAAEAKARGYTKVGILGTRYTMTGPVYPRALEAAGLSHAVPPAGEQDALNRIIFEELCNGVFTDASRSVYVAAIEGLKARGCDAVALVCTEIPLLVTEDVSPLPTLDSTRLLARAAFRAASGDDPLPRWRGGPVKEAGR